MAEPLTAQLADLDTAVSEARDRLQEARRRWRDELGVAVDLLADLTAYREDVEFRKRKVDPAEHSRLTLALCDRIRDEGLILESVKGMNGMLTVRDPARAHELEDAFEALNAAKRDRRLFMTANSGVIEAEAKAERVARVRRALDGDDPTELDEALANATGRGQKRRNILTSTG